MNKKIKIIELWNIIAQVDDIEKLPKKIKYFEDIYELQTGSRDYYCDNQDDYLTDRVNDKPLNSFLNDTVEILEDNTEEIEEIQEISDEYFNMLSDEAKVKWLKSYIKEDRNKINELVKVVKEIRKDLNK